MTLPSADRADGERRGGDQYAIERAHGRPAFLGALILQAMVSDQSPSGRQFNAERLALHLRYARLIAALNRAHLPGDMTAGPVGQFDVEHYFETAQYRFGRPYPRPVELPAHIVEEIGRRSEIASAVIQAKWMEMIASHTLDEISRSPEWNQACEVAERWKHEPALAVQRLKQTRPVRRRWVSQYRAEIDAFCARWRLRTAWAAPALIWNHFLAAKLRHPLPFDELLVGETVMRIPIRIIAPLPGRSPEDVARDADRFRSVTFATTIDAASRRPITVRLPFDRVSMACLEEAHDLAVLVIEWTGDPLVSRVSGVTVPVSDYVRDEAQLRLGRPLTVRESRALSRAITPQVRGARREFLNHGFARAQRRDLDLHARWVAQRLLDPDANTYFAIAEHSSRSDAGAVFLACQSLASMADLDLP